MYTKEMIDVRDTLLSITDDINDTTNWINRIALVVEKAGVNRAYINWNDSPRNVVHMAVREITAMGKLYSLIKVVNEYKEKL